MRCTATNPDLSRYSKRVRRRLPLQPRCWLGAVRHSRGSASSLYQSVRKLLSLPGHFKLWTGHDYPPGGENRTEPLSATTIADQNKSNKHLKEGVTEEEFTKWRKERDATLAEPKLIHQSLQLNIRAGQLPRENEAGDRLLHVPLKVKGLKL